jgi:hypothetical protein
MSSSTDSGRAGLFTRDRLLIAGSVTVAITLAALPGILLTGSDVPVSRTENTDACCRRDGVTPESLSAEIGIRIPETASDRRAGRKSGDRADTGVLAFTLPVEEADVYTSRLVRDGTKMISNLHPEKESYRPPDGFAHLGLPEPETLVEGLRKISVCPENLDTPEGRRLRSCIDLFAHEYGHDNTRLYIKSTLGPA